MTSPIKPPSIKPRARMNDGLPGAGFALVLGAVTLLSPLTVHLFLPALPQVKAGFGATDAQVQLTFSGALVTMAVATPFYGTLSDRYGRRPVLLSGLALFLIGGILAALAPSLPLLIAGRLVQAAGAGSGLALSRAIARDVYGAAALVKAIAYLTMAFSLGPLVAPVVGGILNDHLGWRSVFWLSPITGIAIGIAAFLVVFETHPPAARIGTLSHILHDYALLLRDGRFLAFVLQSGLMSFSFFALAAAAPFLMQDLLGTSATEFGLYFTLLSLGYIAGNLVSSRLSGRADIEIMMLLGSVLCLAAAVVQAALVVAGHLTPLIIVIPGAVMSVAQGLSLPNAQAGAIRIQPALAGTAAGLGVFIQQSHAAMATQLYGMFADGTAIPMVALATLGAFLAVVLSLFLFARRRTDG